MSTTITSPGARMHHTKADLETETETGNSLRMAAGAWVLTAVYYFYQYALRSAPSVMVPQLSEAFGVSTLGVASIAGLFYYGYSPFSLVAGAAMDRLGPRKVRLRLRNFEVLHRGRLSLRSVHRPGKSDIERDLSSYRV